MEEDNDEENGKENINLEMDILVYDKVLLTEYCDATFSFAGKNSDGAGVKDYGNLGPVGADPNQTQQKSARRSFISKKGMWVVWVLGSWFIWAKFAGLIVLFLAM